MILTVLCAVSLLLCAVACSQRREKDDIGGIPVTPEMLESVSQSLAEPGTSEPQILSTASDRTTKASTSAINTATQTKATGVVTSGSTTVYDIVATTVTDATTTTTSTEVMEANEPATDTTAIPDVVYWTENGTVYHLSISCTSLRNSVKVFQGSVADALLAEKERACKLCS